MDNVQSVKPRVPSLYEFAVNNSKLMIDPAEGSAIAESLEVSLEREATSAGPPENSAGTQNKTAQSGPRMAESVDWPIDHSPIRIEQPTRLSPISSTQLTNPRVETINEQSFPIETATPPEEPRLVDHNQAAVSRPDSAVRPPQLSSRPSLLETKPEAQPSSIRVRVRSAAEAKTDDRDLNVTMRDPQGNEDRDGRSFSPATSRPEVEELTRPEFSTNESTSVGAAKEKSGILPKMSSRLDSEVEYPTSQLQVNRAPITEQVVNVTIGRIEVRATQAPAHTTPSPNLRGRTTSLDDYLNKRNHGNRGAGV